jgi:hypothetical protein
VAERLGRGLQSPVQRFESAPRLYAHKPTKSLGAGARSGQLDGHKEEDATLGRPVVMDDGIPTISRYHPAAVLGSLLAGPGRAPVAREDALPLPERASRSERFRLAVARRWQTGATVRVAGRAQA